MTLAIPATRPTPFPALTGLGPTGPLARILRSGRTLSVRMLAELYGLGVDRLLFALAVALCVFLAGWLLGTLDLMPSAPPPEQFVL